MSYVDEKNLSSLARKWIRDAVSFTYERDEFEIDIGRCSLVVIDMQNYFASESGRSFLPASRAILPNILSLVDAFRKSGRSVIFTQHGHASKSDLGILGSFWGDYIKKGEDDWNIIKELEPDSGDLRIFKTRYDAFYGTDLEKIHRKNNSSQVIITGVMTHLCCETTARSAFVRDFEVYFCVDATASNCEELHTGSLRALSHGVAIPVMTEDVINKFNI